MSLFIVRVKERLLEDPASVSSKTRTGRWLGGGRRFFLRGSFEMRSSCPRANNFVCHNAAVTVVVVLDRLEAEFEKMRDAMLTTYAGRWALLVQPEDSRRRPKLVGCFETEHEACTAGYQNRVGRQFLVKLISPEVPVVGVPWAVPADQL